MLRQGLVRNAAAFLILGTVALPLPAQHGRSPTLSSGGARPPDPYTEADPEALRNAAGEFSHGPFAWAGRHGTRKIEETLGEVAPIWIETAHFKLGCTLPAYKIPPGDKEQREKMRSELEELQKKLPTVDPKTRRLDRWLRAHLYAQRLEQIYTDFQELVDLSDTDFPAAPGQLVAGHYRGEGPYLGQRGKYLVLLFEKESSFARYWRRFIGGAADRPMRHNFPGSDSLFFGTATEFFEGFLSDDTALHAHLAFNVLHNLVNGCCHYSYDIPVWLPEGLAHWYAKERVSPRYNNFSQVADEDRNMRKEWKWQPKIRGRVSHDYYPSFAELMAWTDYGQLHFADHMMLWSRVDYLMSLDRADFARFFRCLKEGIPGVRGRPSPAQVVDRERALFAQVYGLAPEEADRAWCRYVLDSYPKK